MMQGRIDIQIAETGWGDSQIADIRALLLSAAGQFVSGFRSLWWPGIHVFYTAENPITLHARRPDGRVAIGLHTRDRLWCQFAFQFGHELVHLIAGHLPVQIKWESTDSSVGWVEESIAEAGSLFVLRAMAKDWETHPPYQNWMDYRLKLREYAQERIDAPEHTLPEGECFPAWLVSNAARLRTNACERTLNTVVAKEILPVFEKTPSAWEAIAYLRTGQDGPEVADHLRTWCSSCPQSVRESAAKIAAILNLHQSSGTEPPNKAPETTR